MIKTSQKERSTVDSAMSISGYTREFKDFDRLVDFYYPWLVKLIDWGTFEPNRECLRIEGKYGISSDEEVMINEVLEVLTKYLARSGLNLEEFVKSEDIAYCTQPSYRVFGMMDTGY